MVICNYICISILRFVYFQVRVFPCKLLTGVNRLKKRKRKNKKFYINSTYLYLWSLQTICPNRFTMKTFWFWKKIISLARLVAYCIVSSQAFRFYASEILITNFNHKLFKCKVTAFSSERQGYTIHHFFFIALQVSNITGNEKNVRNPKYTRKKVDKYF